MSIPVKPLTLDDLLPDPHFRERHERWIAAPPAAVGDAATRTATGRPRPVADADGAACLARPAVQVGDLDERGVIVDADDGAARTGRPRTKRLAQDDDIVLEDRVLERCHCASRLVLDVRGDQSRRVAFGR